MLRDNCKNCVSRCEHAGKNREFICIGGITCKKTADMNAPMRKPMTNGEKIRAMTNEELSKFLMEILDDGQNIPFCKNLDECFDNADSITKAQCMACMMAWLQQPVKEDA